MIIALIIYTYCVIAWTAVVIMLYEETYMMRVEKIFWCVAGPFTVLIITIMGIWEWLTEKRS